MHCFTTSIFFLACLSAKLKFKIIATEFKNQWYYGFFFSIDTIIEVDSVTPKETIITYQDYYEFLFSNS